MKPYETLRKALNEHLKTETKYRVSEETGLKWDTIRRFSKGGSLQEVQFDSLCAYLGLELTPKKKR